MHFYRPQTKLREGNVFTVVCLFTGVYPFMHLDGVCIPVCTWTWGCGHGGVHTPATATAAGGTHPTGMHTFFGTFIKI